MSYANQGLCNFLVVVVLVVVVVAAAVVVVVVMMAVFTKKTRQWISLLATAVREREKTGQSKP